MFECTTSVEHCKGMLFCDKFQTFGQLFSYFNVMLTLSPYYKSKGIEKPSLFDALILILGFYF